MSIAPPTPRLQSLISFLSTQALLSLCSDSVLQIFEKSTVAGVFYPCIRAVDLDQNTIVAVSVGVESVAIGIGIPVFYETQIDNARNADFAQGSGSVTVELSRTLFFSLSILVYKFQNIRIHIIF